MGLTQAITINLEHFSAAGVGQGQAGNGGVPTAYEDRLSAVMQTIALQQRQCSPGVPQDNPQWLQELAGNLQLYYDKVVVPGLEAAKTDDSLAQSAITIALSLARTTALLGLDQDEPFATDVQYIFRSIPIVVKNAYNKTYGRCLDDTSQAERTTEGSKMISDERILHLLGDKGNPKFTEQLAACITGQWTLDENSMATGVDNLSGGVSVINTQSQVATQTVPMTFNASQLWRELDRAGRASGIGPHRHSRVPALLPDVD